MRIRSLAALLVLTACRRGDAPPATIDQARAKSSGESVIVEGVVTVPSGVIDAGFAIADETGGIYVAADSTTRYRSDQVVRVTGTLSDNHGLLVVTPTSIAAADGHPRARVTAGPASIVGERSEGSLVETTGTVTGPVVDDRPYGWKITIRDATGALLVFVPVGARIDVSGIRAGQRLRVRGFSGQYDDHHEILPRSQKDIVVLDS